VMAAVTRYVKAATVTPLRRGVINQEDLGRVVDPAVITRLGGPDRATLLDEGLPKAVGMFTTRARPVALTALADADGRIVVVTAQLTVDTIGKNERGRFHVVRTGELVLSPQPDGSWRIAGYDLTVDRSGKGLEPAVTSAPSTAAGR
jgi:hypothetical protein